MNISIIKKSGTNIINLSFLILCLKMIIPSRVPRLPPKAVIVSNENSLILRFFLIACILSIPIRVREIIFITIR